MKQRTVKVFINNLNQTFFHREISSLAKWTNQSGEHHTCSWWIDIVLPQWTNLDSNPWQRQPEATLWICCRANGICSWCCNYWLQFEHTQKKKICLSVSPALLKAGICESAIKSRFSTFFILSNSTNIYYLCKDNHSPGAASAAQNVFQLTRAQESEAVPPNGTTSCYI